MSTKKRHIKIEDAADKKEAQKESGKRSASKKSKSTSSTQAIDTDAQAPHATSAKEAQDFQAVIPPEPESDTSAVAAAAEPACPKAQEQARADSEARPTDEPGAEAADEPGESAAKEELLEQAHATIEQMRDRYLRLQAEWDNFRKRTANERTAERERAAEKLVTDLLPVLDDLERAVKHAVNSGEGGTLTEGVEAIDTKFLNVLKKYKVEKIDAQNQPFDANKHQAIGTVADDSVPEETVVQVYQDGYEMAGRVIRPAMVITSTK